MSMRPSGVYNTNYIQDQALFRTRVDYFWLIAISAFLFLFPLFSSTGPFGVRWVSQTLLGILADGGILLISITGLNLLLGYTGQISLGQAAFNMLGAYGSAVMVRQTGLPFLIALPVAALFSGVIGLLFGLAALRVKGFYLAMATLAAQFIIPWAIRSYDPNLWADLFGWFPALSDALRTLRMGGQDGLTVPVASIFGVEFRSNMAEYYLVLVFVIIMATAARNLVRSRAGRAWIAIRDNELAAEQLGINVFRYKVLAFFISAVYAGVAGALQAHVKRSIGPDSFDIIHSIEQLGMLVIGGAGFPLGALFGVGFFLFVERFLIDFVKNILINIGPDVLIFLNPTTLEADLQAGLPPLLFGLFLAAFLIYQPRGLAYRWMILQAAWRLRPFSKA